MKTITREEFKKAAFNIMKEAVDAAAKENDLTNGAILQVVGTSFLAKMDKMLFGEED